MKKNKIALIIVLSVFALLIYSYTIGSQIYEGREPSLISFIGIHFADNLFFF